jgi:hypothetical protein
MCTKQTKQTPWPLVRERTIPTERPPKCVPETEIQNVSGEQSAAGMWDDNLTAICERFSRQYAVLKILQTYRVPRPSTGILLHYYYYYYYYYYSGLEN